MQPWAFGFSAARSFLYVKQGNTVPRGNMMNKAEIESVFGIGETIYFGRHPFILYENKDYSKRMFSSLKLQDVISARCDFSRSVLSGSSMPGVNFVGSLFHKAGLRNSFLVKCDLTSRCFDEADLRGVSAFGSEFFTSTFVKADLRNADLHGAHFNVGDFTEANFEGADLSGCGFVSSLKLRGAGLRGIVGADSIIFVKEVVDIETTGGLVQMAREDARAWLAEAARA